MERLRPDGIHDVILSIIIIIITINTIKLKQRKESIKIGSNINVPQNSWANHKIKCVEHGATKTTVKETRVKVKMFILA